MNRATNRAHLRANDHTEADRLPRVGKVLTVSAIVASSTIAGACAGTADDHAARRAAVSLATEVRTLKGSVPWSIDATLNGAVCGAASGNTCTNLQYPEVTGDIGVIVGENLLDKALHAASTPQIIFGYSAGAVVASRWLSEHASDADAPSADNVSFIFIGNPKRKYGGSTTEYTSTPTTPNTQYTVLDISREYDGVSDVPDDPTNLLAVLNSLAGYFFVHTSYSNVDLVNDDKLVWTEGNTTYVLVRTANLPLLDPLRYIGLGFVADALNAPLKNIVDSAYHRDYPGVITDPTAAQQTVDDALRGPAATKSTAPATATTALAAAAAKTAAALVTTASSTRSPQPADAAAPTESAADSDDVVEPKTTVAQAIETDAVADTSAASEADSKADAAESDSDVKSDTATPSRADVEPAKATDTTAGARSNSSSDSAASGTSTSAASS